MDFPIGKPKKTMQSLRLQRDFLHKQEVAEVGNPFHLMMPQLTPGVAHLNVELPHGWGDGMLRSWPEWDLSFIKLRNTSPIWDGKKWASIEHQLRWIDQTKVKRNQLKVKRNQKNINWKPCSAPWLGWWEGFKESFSSSSSLPWWEAWNSIENQLK